MRKPPRPPDYSQSHYIARARVYDFFGGAMSDQQMDKYVREGIITPVDLGRKKAFRKDDLIRLAESGKFIVLPSTDRPELRRARKKARS